MNKQTFLNCLEKKLKRIPKEDREDALNYYREYFEEMGADDEQDVSAEIGTPENIAKTIISQCTEKHVEQQKTEGGLKNNATTVWMLILAVCGAPLALPIALGVIVCILALVLCCFVLILCVYITGAAGVIAGLCLLPAVFIAGGIGQSMVCFGLALLAAGLGIMLFLGAMNLSNASVQGLSALCRRLVTRRGER